MKIRLRHLRYTVAAAEHGSFRRAAERLRVQESAIIRGVGEVEKTSCSGASGEFDDDASVGHVDAFSRDEGASGADGFVLDDIDRLADMGHRRARHIGAEAAAAF